jgi:hypothetical protein
LPNEKRETSAVQGPDEREPGSGATTAQARIDTLASSDELRASLLRLPVAERRRVLEEQAEQILSHYLDDPEWRETQGGDIVDY